VNLFLVRHAKTEKIAVSGKDFERELAEKGRLQAEILNNFITKYDFDDVDIWCSDAVRTKQTLSYFDTQFPSTNIEFKNELYLASATEVKELIWNTESDKDLLVIGHNEGISDIASYFLGEDIHLKTATFIQISFEAKSRQEWSADLGKIQTIFRPQV
jgi:phosphohistidine phosphatase